MLQGFDWADGIDELAGVPVSNAAEVVYKRARVLLVPRTQRGRNAALSKLSTVSSASPRTLPGSACTSFTPYAQRGTDKVSRKIRQ